MQSYRKKKQTKGVANNRNSHAITVASKVTNKQSKTKLYQKKRKGKEKLKLKLKIFESIAYFRFPCH